ncbi:peptide chain release factor N(5)-glutamine methyltransferase [Agrobacterium vitis]|uniref:peptide chain release factor N(5)-glutamine methyltransferase n=1 Tax=Rhizobium/Agrobacterium group TaxID=227290 RepID=UPI0008DC1327|nr:MULTISPECIES: peptide chain release factor N(5)-glutamine methyltransferase [Rhizobium/Agrobacterium group]MCF1436743.1 peptide chain release factor N(5)-glutamine methyltransferase [Allorhizobium ampelinum]MUO90574.1 peptide chain release factor N(5)-glutamine methyltransferase [Agrobacterium vitis]MUZ52449.1 peptide chain release factor N(5)-glutamine methyltransferase [Agrobacterium vitis]MUZ92364.1 peptide chain release factor N(5)-glutamine methyltransferase [Agrobacterium vitis]MVA426
MTGAPVTLKQAITAARLRFAQAGIADAPRDARTLIAGLLGLTATDLILQDNRVLSAEETSLIETAVERRLLFEPVHRILGRRAFYGLELALSPATLEPRPDTEILIERVLPHLHAMVAKNGSVRLLDMGTGTGAIALALLQECPGATALATDISAEALATARQNAAANSLSDRFETLQSHWYEALSGRFDIILSNPPYIVSDVIKDLAPDVRLYDPAVALDGGDDGLDAYRAIAAGAADFLKPGGLVGVEIGYDQAMAVTQLFANNSFVLVESAKDHGDNDRILLFAQTGPQL